MSKQNMAASTTVMGGPARFSYAHVFEPSSMDPEGKKKYSVCLIISKNEKVLLDKIRAAINAAIDAGKSSKFAGKIPPNLKMPLRDGDAERGDDPAFKNSYFVNASSAQKPGIVDVNKVLITSPEEFYSGCYGRFHVNFYAFNTAGNKGIACGLNHLQKLRDGERLAGRVDVADAFDEYVDDAGGAFDEEDDMLG